MGLCAIENKGNNNIKSNICCSVMVNLLALVPEAYFERILFASPAAESHLVANIHLIFFLKMKQQPILTVHLHFHFL